jgi:hypothetical protein
VNEHPTEEVKREGGGSSPSRGKSAVTTAREAARSGGRGCSWCAAKGERRRGKWGAAASGCTRFKRRNGEQRKGGVRHGPRPRGERKRGGG